MPLEPIRRRPINDPARAEFQERIARAVEADPEPFLAAYRREPRTHGGRYVAADLMKEVFPEFSASRAGRTEHNVPLHNSAAVLASEQFRRAVADAGRPERDTALSVTGIPGAGKTSTVLDNQRLAPEVRVVYEGQLARPESALPKIQAALDQGLKVQIIAIHVQPEAALENTFERFGKEGRGAGVEAMAGIQGNLPGGLAAIRARFGERVGLTIIDRRAGMNRSQRLDGWDKLPELASEGTYEQIKERLHAAINRHEAAGSVRPAAIREARGLPPLARDRRLSRPDGGQSEHAPAGGAAREEHRQPLAAGVQPRGADADPLTLLSGWRERYAKTGGEAERGQLTEAAKTLAGSLAAGASATRRIRLEILAADAVRGGAQSTPEKVIALAEQTRSQGKDRGRSR